MSRCGFDGSDGSRCTLSRCRAAVFGEAYGSHRMGSYPPPSTSTGLCLFWYKLVGPSVSLAGFLNYRSWPDTEASTPNAVARVRLGGKEGRGGERVGEALHAPPALASHVRRANRARYLAYLDVFARATKFAIVQLSRSPINCRKREAKGAPGGTRSKPTSPCTRPRPGPVLTVPHICSLGLEASTKHQCLW